MNNQKCFGSEILMRIKYHSLLRSRIWACHATRSLPHHGMGERVCCVTSSNDGCEGDYKYRGSSRVLSESSVDSQLNPLY